jgi:hypothetical protein
MNPYAEIDPVDPKRIVVQIPFTMKDLIKQLPGSTWSHKDQRVEAPARLERVHHSPQRLRR